MKLIMFLTHEGNCIKMTYLKKLQSVAFYTVTLLLLCACLERNISDEETRELLDPFFSAEDAHGMEEALSGAEKTAQTLRISSLRQVRADETSERNRKILHLLKTLPYEVAWGLTDAEIRSLAKKGKITKKIEKLFENELVVNDLNVLFQLDPDHALALVMFLCRVPVVENGPLPQGATQTTWAAEDLASVVHDLKLSQLAVHSEVVRLFIAAKLLAFPEKVQMQFRWSKASPIDIEVPSVPFSQADFQRCESVMDKEILKKYTAFLETMLAHPGVQKKDKLQTSID